MRMFVAYESVRVKFDVDEDTTVGEVKERVRDVFGIGPDEGPVGTDQQDKKILKLSYSGADLEDEWFISDVGVTPSATVKAVLKDEVKPIFYIHSKYSDEMVPVLDKLQLIHLKVSDLRGIVSRKTGLPVSVFRLLSEHNLVMYDCHPLDYYGVTMGCTIIMECWDGWRDLLTLAVHGFTTAVLKQLHHDEVIARFQQKVALYIAAHFGNVDLALTLMKQGIRPDEATGEHPSRQWCKSQSPHVDSFKAPIHEAAEFGQLGVLRSFVHSHVGYVLAKDGNGLNALNLALRKKQKSCAQFLLTKQWSRINYGKKKSKTAIPLSIFVKMKRWAEEAKDKIYLVHGQWKSSIKNPKHHINSGALVGYGVQLDGFSQSNMQSRPYQAVRVEEQRAEEKRRRMYNYTADLVEKNGGVDPETYFKHVAQVENARLPRLPAMSRFSRAGTRDLAEHKEESHDNTKENNNDSHYSPLKRITNHNSDNNDASQGANQSTPQKALPPIKEKLLITESVSQRRLQGENGPARKRHALFIRGKSEETDEKKLMHSEQSHGRTHTDQNHNRHEKSHERSQAKSSLSSQSITSQDLNPISHPAPEQAQSPRRHTEPPRRGRVTQVRTQEGISLALPMASLDTHNRPYMSDRADDPGVTTLESFRKQRGMDSRDYAIRCLTVANSYNKKPWLEQVQIAMTIAAKGVHKTVTNRPHMFTDSPRPSERAGAATV